MCGIIGYNGKENAIPILIEGLKSLEYRGYDSSGIAYFTNNKIKIFSLVLIKSSTKAAATSVSVSLLKV